MKVLLLLFLASLAAACVDYDGAQFLHVTPKDDQQHLFLKSLMQEFDFFKPSLGKGDHAKVLAKADQVDSLKGLFEIAGLEVEVTVANVGEFLQQQRQQNEDLRNINGKAMEWSAYHTYDEIMAWCDQIAIDYPTLVTTTDVGNSFEGRVMKKVVITKGTATGKKKMFVDGGIHAREWISPAVATYFMNELLINADTLYNDSLSNIELTFMPVINPDGYDYTWVVDGVGDRLWRKTRNVFDGVNCVGTDGNRNWDFKWGLTGSSTIHCSDQYQGPTPFSEVEFQLTSSVMVGIGGEGDRHMYLSLHSYGQLILYPWGYWKNETAPNNQELIDLSVMVETAMEGVHGTDYIPEQAAKLYEASGASDDWALGVGGFDLAFTIELRDQNTFELLPEEIIPTGEESMAGFVVLMDYIMAN